MLFVVLAPPALALGQPVPPADARREALALFTESEEAYNAGRFGDAVRLLERAYGLHQESTLLYNLARAHEGAGNDLAARDAYERYLVSNPDTADRGAIEGRIAALEAAITREAALREGRERAQAEAELARAEADRAQAEAERRQTPAVLRDPSPWPWTLGGVGLAGLAAGGIMGGLALAAEDAAAEAPDHATAYPEGEQALMLATGANIALAVGGAVLLTATIWLVIDLLTLGEQDTLSLRAAPGRLALRWEVP